MKWNGGASDPLTLVSYNTLNEVISISIPFSQFTSEFGHYIQFKVQSKKSGDSEFVDTYDICVTSTCAVLDVTDKPVYGNYKPNTDYVFRVQAISATDGSFVYSPEKSLTTRASYLAWQVAEPLVKTGETYSQGGFILTFDVPLKVVNTNDPEDVNFRYTLEVMAASGSNEKLLEKIVCDASEIPGSCPFDSTQSVTTSDFTLQPSTTYYFQMFVEAVNSNEAVRSTEQSFVTPSSK